MPKGSKEARTFNPESTQFFSIAMLQLAEEVPDWVKQTQEHLKNKRYLEAQRSAEEGLKQNPRQLDGLLYLAEAHWEQVHPKEAVDNLKQAIQVAPKDSRPYALLGRYLLLKGLREQAVKFLEQAVTLNPNDQQSRKQLDRTRNLIKRGYKKVEAAPGVLGSSEAKKEATRMVSLQTLDGANGAAAAIPAMGTVEIEQALGALLSASLFELDIGTVQSGRSSSGRFARFFVGLIVFSLAIAVGVPFGMLVRKKLSSSRAGTPLERATQLIREDSAPGYIQATELLEKIGTGSPEYEPAQPMLALAHAVRAVDLGGGSYFREAAERALTSLEELPEELKHGGPALLARHLVGVSSGKPDETLPELFDKAMAAHPDDAWLHVLAGRRAEDRGEDAVAVDAYRNAYRKDPTLPLAVHHLARAHARLGDRVEALALVDRLLNLVPRHGGGIVLGLLLAQEDAEARGRYQARAQELLAGTGVHPDTAAFVAIALALLLQSEGKSDEAAPFWERAAQMGENRTVGYWQLGVMRFAVGDLDAARALLEKALEKDESDLRFHLDHARLESVAARGPEWLAQLKASFSVENRFPVLRFPLGSVYLRPGAVLPFETVLNPAHMPNAELAAALDVPELSTLGAIKRVKAADAIMRAHVLITHGKADEARELLSEVLADNKRDPDLILATARAEAAAQQWDKALGRVEDLLADDPANGPALLLLAHLQVQTGEAGAALKSLSKVESAGVVSPRTHVLRARALLQQKKAGPAEKELQKALNLIPGEPDVAQVRAELATQKKKPEDAHRAWVDFARAAPERVAGLVRLTPSLAPELGWALADAGQAEAGVALVRKHLEANADDPSGQFALGVALVASGQAEEGKAALQKFLDAAEARDVRRGVAERALKDDGQAAKTEDGKNIKGGK